MNTLADTIKDIDQEIRYCEDQLQSTYFLGSNWIVKSKIRRFLFDKITELEIARQRLKDIEDEQF